MDGHRPRLLTAALHAPMQVFWAVMERGGYQTVTDGKQWKEVRRRCGPSSWCAHVAGQA